MNWPLTERFCEKNVKKSRIFRKIFQRTWFSARAKNYGEKPANRPSSTPKTFLVSRFWEFGPATYRGAGFAKTQTTPRSKIKKPPSLPPGGFHAVFCRHRKT
jgi:hypothetical protein